MSDGGSGNQVIAVTMLPFMASGSEADGRPRLGNLIRDRREKILLEWERLVRAEPSAAELSSPVLRDEMPLLLTRIASILEADHPSGGELLHDLPDRHALARLDLGFDLETIVTEYKLLRSCVLDLYASVAHDVVSVRELERLNASIDGAIGRSVGHYATVRGRTLLALDQLSQAALGSDDLDVFLPRLLQVIVETVEAVDIGVIFLWRDGALHVGASVGVDRDFSELVLAMGEGFAGTVAAQRRELELCDAAANEMVKPRALPADTKALYGIPLLEGERLVGVAYMGSRTAHEFAREDIILLRAMASRATVFIVQARLRQAERTERERAQQAEWRLRQTAEFRETFLGVLSHDLRNLVATISGTARALLASKRLDDRTETMVARMHRTTDQMTRMIGDLLDFTRGRLGGGIPVFPKPADMGVICSQVVDEVSAAHPDHEFRFEADGDLRGEWDEDRMAQAVMNLCTNAGEHGAPRTPVDVVVSGHGDTVSVSVADESEPIPPEQLATLFEPYRRLSHAGTSTGLGLGLFIVREVARAHAGTVEARQEDGRVVLTMRLPRRAPAALP